MKYLVILFGLFSSSCLADLNQDTPVPDLYVKSDHVFAGRVTAAHRTAQAAGSVGAAWLIDFEPLRLYKGTFGPGIITVGVVEFNESWGSPGNPGESQLIFAKKSTGESSAPLVLPSLFPSEHSTSLLVQSPACLEWICSVWTNSKRMLSPWRSRAAHNPRRRSTS